MTTPADPGVAEAAVLKAAVADLAKRAGHTFWQAASGTAGTLWAASGLDVHQVLTVSGSEKFLLTVVVGAAAAGASAVKSLVATYLSSKKALS